MRPTMQEVVNELCDDFTQDIADAKTKTRQDTFESLDRTVTSHVHGFLNRHEPIPVSWDDVYQMVQNWACGPNLTSMARRKGYETGKGYHPEPTDGEIKDADEWCGVVHEVFYDHTIQYSPWEFTAKEYNESRDPDATWAAFDRGLMAGARRKWRETQQGRERHMPEEVFVAPDPTVDIDDWRGDVASALRERGEEDYADEFGAVDDETAWALWKEEKSPEKAAQVILSGHFIWAPRG